MRVSLVLTVLNEADSIAAFLESLRGQTKAPDEVVVCDAGSVDGTVQALSDFASTYSCPLVVIHRQGNRSIGRNAAIRHASHSAIAVTDAGCILHSRWLERLAQPLAEALAVDVVAGFYVARGRTLFEKCAGAATVGTWGVRGERFLPSARSMAFRRSAWEAVNGFPEDLAFAEDTVFAKRLREDGQRFAFVPSALVFWTPRRSLGSVVRQGWNYGRGDGLARISGATYARMHARYAVWLALTAGSAFTPWCVALLALSLLPYWSLWSAQGFRATRDWRAIILTPAIKLSFDAGRLSGYWAGRLG